MSKIELDEEKDYPWKAKGNPNKPVRFMLPFFKSDGGRYFHRVRSAANHWRDGELSHTHVNFWCGATGFLGSSNPRKPKTRLYAKLPDGAVMCATCEGRAIGSGLDGTREINGRPVMYSPRAGFDGQKGDDDE